MSEPFVFAVDPPVPALPPPEPDVDPRFDILWEDEALAVVSKSGNLPCHPCGRYYRNTLEMKLREHGFPGVYFISRLDRETSGCVVVAKTVEAASRLGKAMMGRHFEKEYLCAVRGATGFAPGEVRSVKGLLWPVGDDFVFKYRFFKTDEAPPGPADGFTGAVRGPAQTCETELEALPSDRFGAPPPASITLFRCKPVTGRTHQIRATFKGLGCDVLGDKLYGPDARLYRKMCDGALTEDDRRALGMRRQALHAWKIAFRHPMSGEMIRVEAEPSAFLAEVREAAPAE